MKPSNILTFWVNLEIMENSFSFIHVSNHEILLFKLRLFNNLIWWEWGKPYTTLFEKCNAYNINISNSNFLLSWYSFSIQPNEKSFAFVIINDVLEDRWVSNPRTQDPLWMRAMEAIVPWSPINWAIVGVMFFHWNLSKSI